MCSALCPELLVGALVTGSINPEAAPVVPLRFAPVRAPSVYAAPDYTPKHRPAKLPSRRRACLSLGAKVACRELLVGREAIPTCAERAVLVPLSTLEYPCCPAEHHHESRAEHDQEDGRQHEQRDTADAKRVPQDASTGASIRRVGLAR